MQEKKRWLNRAAIALVLLFSGFAMLPFARLSAEELDWQLFGGIYEPEIDIVADRGAAGSAFYFTAANFPANALATIYVDGNPVGTLTTDGSGRAEFVIQTFVSDPEGNYDVTMATDANNADTDSYRIDNGDPAVPPPNNYTGPIFNSDGSPLFRFFQYLPFIGFD